MSNNPHASETTEQTPKLDERTKVFAATNSPALAKDEFQLGGRTFKVLFLGYTRQMEFLSLLLPLIGKLKGSDRRVLANAGITDEVPGIASIVTECADQLPALVAIICNEQEHRRKDGNKQLVDADWVVSDEHEVTPITLAKIVFKQIVTNKLINEIADFFGSILPMLLGEMEKQTTK